MAGLRVVMQTCDDPPKVVEFGLTAGLEKPYLPGIQPPLILLCYKLFASQNDFQV